MSARAFKPPPPWEAEDKDVCVQVKQALLELEEDRQDATFWAENWDLVPDLPAADVARDMERQALDAWRRGDPNPLTNLLRPNHPFNVHGWNGRPIRDQLSDEAWSVVCDRLLGKPLKRGRPKLTDEERHVLNPKHDAAAMVSAIEGILHEHYPDHAPQVRDRARAIAEMLAGIDDPESAGSKVGEYLNRSKKDRGRLPP